jgi:glycosyltransferase involved in cell wall biosynthesis
MAMLLDPVTYYRASRWLYLRHVPLLPRLLKVFNEMLFHCELPYTAKIGRGFEVQHRGFGIVVHPRAEIGRNVVLSPCITIGGRNGKYEVPRLGDNVFVASGARILGDVTIGDGAVIGANAVVTRSVPARSIAAGVPARIIRENIQTAEHTGLPKVFRQSRGPNTGLLQPASVKQPVRALLFIHSLELGGSEKQCIEVAARLAKDGYAVTIGCLQATGPLRARVAEAGLPLAVFPAPRLLRPSALVQAFKLVFFLRKNRFQVVHANDLYSNLFAVPAAWVARVPVVISSQRDLSHWSWYTPTRRKILRKIQGLSSWLVVNSAAIRADLMARDGFDARKIRVIHNGVEAGRFTPGQQIPREPLPGVSPGNKLIVMVANMHLPVKGHSDLITAAQDVCREHPAARFLLIGDGEMRSVFKRQVREMGLGHAVLFLGRRTDVPEVLSCCEIGVLASWAEGLPNAVLEYMAAGLATVATCVGGVPEIIRPEVNGLLVPAKNPAALGAALLRLLNNEPLRLRLASAARESVLANFDYARVLEHLKSLYQGSSPVVRPSRQPREANVVEERGSYGLCSNQLAISPTKTEDL